MQFKLLIALLLLAFFSLPRAVSQTAAPPVPAPAVAARSADYSSESFVIQKYATDVTYQADGTGERINTVQVKIQADTAVRQFGVIEFPYESRNEHLDFVYVRVRKADGTVIATPDTDAQDQPAEVTRQAPFYSDIRNKQLPVKSLAVGDLLEYQVREVRTVAAAPGHFWYIQNFLKDAVVLEETASLTVPRQKYVQVESQDVKPQITESGDVKIYRWKTAQLEKTKAPDDKAKKPVIVEQPPSIAVTTFKSWDEVGRWYGDLQKDRVSVTPAIQSKARELAKAGATDEGKIAAIYTYVSTQYRYIGVAFGIGRYQPHTADDVMQNQYGDCKDKHTLLASLLKAAGYDAWPALVGSQHVLQPDVPSPGQFDHVITAVTLNKSVLWMDSTTEVAPFRMLFSGLRDKLVLGIPNNSIATLMKTPPNTPFDSVNKYEGKATLASDGTLTAHFDVTLRGDTELLFRIGFHQTPRVQWQTLVQNVSYSTGFAGTVSNIDASSPEQLAKPFQYSYDYTRKDFADWPNRRIVSLIPLVAFPYGEDDPKPVETILLGGPVTYTFHSSIQLPQGYTAELPANAKQQTDFAEYFSKYSQTNGVLIVDRTFTLKQREIPVSRWDEYLKFEKAVTAEAGGFIQLIGSGADIHAGLPAAEASDAPGLVQQAFTYLRTEDVESARKSLDAAAKVSPQQIGLWAGYAYADAIEHKDDGAVANYRKEIKYHPENFGVYLSLAGVQLRMHDTGDAIDTLYSLLKAAPDYKGAHAQLGSVLLSEKRFAEAAIQLEKAISQSPDDKDLKVLLGTAQLSSGAKEQGVLLLRSLLTGSNDESVLNDAAYALADADVELPLARSSCTKALQLLDQASAATTLPTLTDRDLRNTVHLAATWDTMAWILYRQGEFAHAEQYARASWALDQRPLIADHLAQIDEKLGKQSDATVAYQMAIVAGRNSENAGVAEAQMHLKLLRESSLRPPDSSSPELSAATQKLAEMRATAVKIADKQTGSADFLLLFSPGHLEDLQFVRGDEAFKAYGSALKAAPFDVRFPDDSHARLVRRGTLFCSNFLPDCRFTLISPETTRRD